MAATLIPATPAAVIRRPLNYLSPRESRLAKAAAAGGVTYTPPAR